MKQNDILGIGCTVYEIVTGEVINNSNQNFKLFLLEIRSEDQTLCPSGKCWDVSFEMINFLQFIFDADEKYRATVVELYESPFFKLTDS